MLAHYSVVAISDGKTLTKAESANVLKILERYVNDRHEGNKTRAALALGVSQALVSNLLNKRSEPGLRIVRAMARILGASQTEILNGGSDMAVTGRLPLAGMAGWDDAEAEAKARHPRLDPTVWDQVARIAWPVEMTVTPDLVADLAYALVKHAPPVREATDVATKPVAKAPASVVPLPKSKRPSPRLGRRRSRRGRRGPRWPGRP